MRKNSKKLDKIKINVDTRFLEELIYELYKIKSRLGSGVVIYNNAGGKYHDFDYPNYCGLSKRIINNVPYFMIEIVQDYGDALSNCRNIKSFARLFVNCINDTCPLRITVK